MSNIPSCVNEENQPIPLAIVFRVYGEDTIPAAEEESLPIVEEIIPRSPDAKPDLQRLPEVMIEKFQSSMTTKHLTEFKVKYGLPDHMELIPIDNDEVHTRRPGYYAI